MEAAGRSVSTAKSAKRKSAKGGAVDLPCKEGSRKKKRNVILVKSEGVEEAGPIASEVDVVGLNPKKRKESKSEEPHTGPSSSESEKEVTEATTQQPAGEGDAQTEPGTQEEKLEEQDPYLLEEATYLRTEKRWVNKQRTLVVASRGIGARHRHLLEDLKKLLPHHKAESKWERSQKLYQITELCELRACNNVLFLEQRKRDALLHIAKAPMGPTLICRVVNVHTLQELRLTGNCLLHSRPLLLFGAEFERQSPLRLIKELLVQVIGTPRNHPKSKPFFDHVICFFFQDSKIWFRHYQIEPLVLGQGGDADKPDRQTFTEIGPRFVLEPIKILEGCFSGKTLWRNSDFVATRDLIQPQKLRAAINFARRQDAKEKRKLHVEEVLKKEPKNPLAFEEVFGTENFEKRKK